MGKGDFNELDQVVEARNEQNRPALAQAARDRYIKQLKSDTALYYVDVVSAMPQELIEALHAFSNNCGPKSTSRLTLALHELEETAIAAYVAANWEPQNEKGDYVLGQVAS